MRLLLCLCLAFAVAQAAYDVGRKCKQGEKGEKEGIRYFVDAERQTVYPFLFPGCGGTANNRFKTRRGALDTLQVDGIQCPGWSKSQGECGNRPLRQGETGDGCPKGTVCQMGHAFGLCCNEKATARYIENYKATCPKKSKGAQKYYDTHKDGFVEFGRSCFHNFCKKGATCVQGEFEAYCCLN